MGYGPARDYSRFVTARLADDGNNVVFGFHRLVYRPAAGIRAFPDGGIPKYLADKHILGVYDRNAARLTILRKEPNRIWTDGQGETYVTEMNGPMVLVSQAGQGRRNLSQTIMRHCLVNWQTGKAEELDLRGDFASRGRDPGIIYLVDGEGTLLFVTHPLEEPGSSGKSREEGIPEVWVRTPKGEYVKVAATAHYEEYSDGEVIYWQPDTRQFFAFRVSDKTTRRISRHNPPPLKDATAGVNLSGDRKSLEYGTKKGDQWEYVPLGLTADMLP